MKWSKLKHTWAVAIVASFVWVIQAEAAQWDDRTIMTFSESVRVPGTTLEPGTYVFELAEPDSAPHVIRITEEKSNKVVATVQAVPMKRTSTTGDTVLKFNPSQQGAPVALQAWFYPNSTYGHQFVYDDDEARDIANRTKTIVLTMDKPAGDARSGTLMVYNAAGLKAGYQADEATTREWAAWKADRKASAPIVPADTKDAMRVSVDALEDGVGKFVGQRVSVDGEVEDIYGPRLFTIDEPNWGDLEGEILVYMPSAAALSLRDDDRVTVTGEVRKFVLADVEREWGWINLDSDVLVRLQHRPILVADRIVGGDDDSVFVIDAAGAASPTKGSPGSPGGNAPITDVTAIVEGEEALVGRRVELSDVRVAKTGKDGGFFVEKNGKNLFVLSSAKTPSVKAGDMVSVAGVILQTPRSMDQEFESSGASTHDVYVFATKVS